MATITPSDIVGEREHNIVEDNIDLPVRVLRRRGDKSPFEFGRKLQTDRVRELILVFVRWDRTSVQES